MCGIAGHFAYQASAATADEEELLAVRDAMVARGPDDSGLWFSPDRRLGLAHRRLSIIDTSSEGKQPMATSDGRFVIVYNGELYNYRELKADLESRGCQFRSNSDTEVLLHLYADKGRAFVHELRGMFAFAIWDRDAGELLLARDPFGIKPLYYADSAGCLRFASTVKALLHASDIDTSVDAAGHVGFFLLGSVPEPRTFYRGIRQLPSGSMLRVSLDGRCHISRYCDVAQIIEEAEADSSYQSLSEAARSECLAEVLHDSIKHHLLSDVPIGFFLSAGLDSTSLISASVNGSATETHTVTLGFDEFRDTELDETVLAEEVAKQFGTVHQTKWVNQQDFSGCLPQFLAAMDQPTIDGINSYFVSKVAADAGLTVALSGLGGDELFAGYPSFHHVPQMVKLCSTLPVPAKLGAVFRCVSAPMLKRFTSPKYAGVFEYGSTYAGAYLLRRGLYMPWELEEVLDADVARVGWQELEPTLRVDDNIAGIKSEQGKVSALEMTWYMRNQLLRDSDWAGMAHSLEIRVPFVDIVLLRKTLALYADRLTFTKQNMVHALKAPLPTAITQRKKTGFMVPVRDWMIAERPAEKQPRGWRGWAQFVYENYNGAE